MAVACRYRAIIAFWYWRSRHHQLQLVFVPPSSHAKLMDDIFAKCAFYFFPGSDMMADEFSVLSDPFWPWWIWNWRWKRALGRRLDRLNQSIYIQLGGCIFFSFSISLVCMCVGGGWEVRAALMILKWQGPEFFRTCGRAAAVAAAAFFVFLFFSLSPLSSASFCFYLSFYSPSLIHTHTHTHAYPHRHKRPPTLPFGWMEYLFHFHRSSLFSLLLLLVRLLLLLLYIFNSPL